MTGAYKMNNAEYIDLTRRYVLEEGADWSYGCECPRCGGDAISTSYERAEGAINVYTRTRCQECGFHEDTGSQDDDSYDAEYDLCETLFFASSNIEEALEKVGSSKESWVYLIEGRKLRTLSKVASSQQCSDSAASSGCFIISGFIDTLGGRFNEQRALLPDYGKADYLIGRDLANHDSSILTDLSSGTSPFSFYVST